MTILDIGYCEMTDFEKGFQEGREMEARRHSWFGRGKTDIMIQERIIDLRTSIDRLRRDSPWDTWLIKKLEGQLQALEWVLE